MKITLENYEAYYLDYIEGNLNSKDTDEFLSFLLIHPELQIEDIEFTSIKEYNTLTLPDTIKSKILRIPEVETKFSNLCIEKIEGLLSENENEKLIALIEKEQRYQYEFNLYSKTKLHADQSIIYPFKSSLIKGKKRNLFPYFSILAAASVVGIIYLTYQSNTIENKQKKYQSSIIKNTNKNPQLQLVTRTSINPTPRKQEIKPRNQIKQELLKVDLAIPHEKTINNTQTDNDLAIIPDSTPNRSTPVAQFKQNYISQNTENVIYSNKSLVFSSVFNETRSTLKELNIAFKSMKLTDEDKKNLLTESQLFHDKLSKSANKALDFLDVNRIKTYINSIFAIKN